MKSIYIIILIFFIYSFIGWFNEVIIQLINKKKFVNRGFLIGPICPIYGFGGTLIILLLRRYENDPLILFIMAIIICSIIEYFTSYFMEKIFKNRWWDYSDKKFNINGRICLECAIPFGILGVIGYYGLNPLLTNILNIFSEKALMIVTIILCTTWIVDTIISFKVILNLKNISSKINSDSTEAITKKVKEILLNKNVLNRRLVKSFPNMEVFNRMYILKEKYLKEKNKIRRKRKTGK